MYASPHIQADSPEQLEQKFQELRAQQVRAALLFHGYGSELDDDDLDDFDAADPYDE